MTSRVGIGICAALVALTGCTKVVTRYVAAPSTTLALANPTTTNPACTATATTFNVDCVIEGLPTGTNPPPPTTTTTPPPPGAEAVNGGYMVVGGWSQSSNYGSVTINIPITLCSTGASTVRVDPATNLVLYGTPDATGTSSGGVGPGPDGDAPIEAAPGACANEVVQWEYWQFGTNGTPQTLALTDFAGLVHAQWRLAQ